MTDVKPHVKVVQHPNPTRRSFHVTREVTEGGSERYGFGDHYFDIDRKKPGELVKLLADRLRAIPGVTSARFEPYEISVGISEAFDWSDIGPVVLGEIVNVLFPETLGNTIEISANIGWSYYVRPSGHSLDDDDGYRVRYKDTAKREVVEVEDPQILDVERFLNAEAVQKAEQKVTAEPMAENLD
ncbi:MAG: hypothetical protein Q7R67_00940 [bacterium]|nr:hypothetical protein [bacterium]